MADNVLRFEMSGRRFAFDCEREITADELWALDEIGVTASEMGELANGAMSNETMTRAVCALAYLAARRVNPATTWREFSRTIAPTTFRIIPDGEPAGVGEALLADKPKRTPRKRPPTVAEALAETPSV